MCTLMVHPAVLAISPLLATRSRPSAPVSFAPSLSISPTRSPSRLSPTPTMSITSTCTTRSPSSLSTSSANPSTANPQSPTPPLPCHSLTKYPPAKPVTITAFTLPSLAKTACTTPTLASTPRWMNARPLRSANFRSKKCVQCNPKTTMKQSASSRLCSISRKPGTSCWNLSAQSSRLLKKKTMTRRSA